MIPINSFPQCRHISNVEQNQLRQMIKRIKPADLPASRQEPLPEPKGFAKLCEKVFEFMVTPMVGKDVPRNEKLIQAFKQIIRSGRS